MKPKTEKKSSWVYVKFALIVVVAGLFGAACNIITGTNFESFSHLGDSLSRGLYGAGVPLLACGMLLAIAATGLYLAAKKPMARADEDDEAYEQANRRLCLSMILTTLGFPWFMLTMGLCFSPAMQEENLALTGLGLLLLIAQLVWFSALQAIVISATKKLFPEKRGNVFDTKFQKDWYASCDEAEQKTIGDCSYFTFRIMNILYPIVMVALFMVGSTWTISALWFVLLGGLWLVQTLAYQLRCYWLQHVKSHRS